MWKIEVKGRQMSIRVHLRAIVRSTVAADDHVASAVRGTNWIWEMLFVWLSLVMDTPHKSPSIRDQSSVICTCFLFLSPQAVCTICFHSPFIIRHILSCNHKSHANDMTGTRVLVSMLKLHARVWWGHRGLISNALWEACPEDALIVDTFAPLSTCGGVYVRLCHGLGGRCLSELISALL